MVVPYPIPREPCEAELQRPAVQQGEALGLLHLDAGKRGTAAALGLQVWVSRIQRPASCLLQGLAGPGR